MTYNGDLECRWSLKFLIHGTQAGGCYVTSISYWTNIYYIDTSGGEKVDPLKVVSGKTDQR